MIYVTYIHMAQDMKQNDIHTYLYTSVEKRRTEARVKHYKQYLDIITHGIL